MCGIVGLVAKGVVDKTTLEALRDRLTHRGPDQSGSWTADNVGLAHRRLSIIDTSSAGQQPMTSSNQRWVLTYNGEIYNFEELRNDLAHTQWRGHSDTEVLVEAIAAWGIEATLKRLNGIFAFAAFDRDSRLLYLARDQVGVKPLYYGVADGCFYFASEMHAINGLPGLSLNHAAVTSFLRYRYIPSPASIYNEVFKLQPGHLLCLDADQPGQLPVTQPYWQLRDHVSEAVNTISLDEATDQLDQRLREAIQGQLVSDVPIGAFLSGGVDSSLVCAIANAVSDTQLRTFSIGFDDASLNEAPHAKAIANHLGTNHTELYVSEQDLLDTVTRLPDLCDEPFADSSILPTYLVSKMARAHVTVVLSGDGGDEQFWGYTRYTTTERLWRTLKPWPRPLRSAGAGFMRQRWLQSLTNPIHGIALGGRRGSLGQKLAAASEFIDSANPGDLYHQMVSHWRRPADVLVHPEAARSVYADETHWTRQLSLWPHMAHQDFLCYLPDDVLTKVDRASMQVSLEARVPLLDRSIVEFAATLPPQLKAANAQSKILLKHLLARYVPEALFERPKAGFGVPLAGWLRGPLHAWADELLSHPSLAELFDPQVVQSYWRNHLSAKQDNSAKLWDVLMLQNWRMHQGS